MGALMRGHDWEATPWGAPATWPQSLQTALSMCLNAKIVSALYWGPDFRVLYNDAYAPALAERHPGALGLPLSKVWPEIWDVLAPQLASVIETGEGFVTDSQRLMMKRHGRLEETYWTYSFAPIRVEAGGVGGVFVTAMDTTARILDERRLTAERERLMILLDQAHGFMAMLNGRQHLFEFANPAYLQLIGHRDVIGMPVREALPEVEGQGFFELLDQVYASGQPFRGNAMRVGLQRIPGAPIQERFVDLVYQPIIDASGAVTGIFVEGHDVTEMHLSQLALRDSEEFNSRILASSDDCIKVLDLDGKLTFMSEGGQRVMEVSDFNAIRGCPWEGFWQDQENLKAKAAVADAKAGRSAQFQGHATTMAGTPRFWDVRVTPILDADGCPEKILSISRDITATWLAEEALRSLNESLEQRVGEQTRERDRLWRNSQDIQVVIDGQGVFYAINPAFTTILGWTPEEVVGRPVFDFVISDDEALTESALQHARRESLPTVENRYRHKDGGHRWISWVAAPEEELIYASGRHITAEKAAAIELAATQEQLRQAQKMDAVGQLTGGVAHDFNNLLTVIKSASDLLKRSDVPGDRRQRYVAAISDTVDRAAKLTAQLLAFARRQALKPEVFDATRSVRDLADMMNTLTGSRITINLQLAETCCFINADPNQFDTALVNMAVNARDAMDGQGSITISVQPVDNDSVAPRRASGAGRFVGVSISDDGCGIAAEDLERIFEPFFTTKGVGQGTGLGLSQVFGFAKQSGGEVIVESLVGKGTTFTLYLPQVDKPDRLADEAELEELMDGHGTCVLVVEDNVDVGTFATQTLAELGYETVWAANAEEALAELTKNADRFDVVFSDVVMTGMNGMELAQQIRREHHDLPVVLTSGYSDVLAQNGTYGFELLHKPYSVEQLSRVLRKSATWQRRRRILDK